MTNLIQLRKFAREIFDEALREVNPWTAMQRNVVFDGSNLSMGGASFDIEHRNIYSISVGKASIVMAAALEAILRDKLTAGLIAGPTVQPLETTLSTNLSGRWMTFEGGHPLPNEASLRAAHAAFELLERADKENALILFLVSGGGSAMIESPISTEITLADLQNANLSLVNSGASIGEINSVRTAFSAIKGGRLAARAPNCDQITLIVSDVRKGQEHYVSSGPSLPPSKDAPQPAKVISRFDLRAKLPLSIATKVYKPASEALPQVGQREYFVLLDNSSALNAAAHAALDRGFTVNVAHNISDQPIDVGCEKLLEELRREVGLRLGTDFCVISGGEFSCPVRGEGLGGRSLETALRLAIEADQTGLDNFVALCAGTDGIDGNSPAAGAIVDSTTIERAHKIGLNPQDFLNRSDAYSFFVALGDAITTGPTGTNVRDLRILLESA
jgi:hydroxypyruvate reductase